MAETKENDGYELFAGLMAEMDKIATTMASINDRVTSMHNIVVDTDLRLKRMELEHYRDAT